MGKFIDLTGRKFGRWTVIKISDERNHRNCIVWKCECECGNVKLIKTEYLKNGESKSCGCLLIETVIKRSTKHNLSRSRGYKAWAQLIQRCNNPNATYYKYYGGRGIKVCERWKEFKNFHEDMGDCPDGLEINRIDNNKGYFKENCEWTTRKRQMRNINSNVNLTFNNKTQCLSDWARDLDTKVQTLWNRINRYNWPIEKALSSPVKKINRKID